LASKLVAVFRSYIRVCNPITCVFW